MLPLSRIMLKCILSKKNQNSKKTKNQLMGDGKNPRGKVGPRSRNSYHLSHIILLAI